MKKTPGKNKKEKLLTEVELEIMSFIWKLGGGTVNQVLELLPKSRKLAYTSVSTMLRILEQKGFLNAKKEGRGHLYLPRISREEYGSRSLNRLVDKVFEGTPSSLVRCLIESGKMNEEDLEAIRSTIREQEVPR